MNDRRENQLLNEAYGSMYRADLVAADSGPLQTEPGPAKDIIWAKDDGDMVTDDRFGIYGYSPSTKEWYMGEGMFEDDEVIDTIDVETIEKKFIPAEVLTDLIAIVKSRL